MRAFAAVVLGLSLTALPLMANDANNAGTEDSSALTSANSPNETAKPENAVESEVQDLRNLIEEQRQELAEQRAALKALEEKLSTSPAAPATTVPVPTAVTVASSPAPIGVGGASMPAQKSEEESPLYFKIGGAEFYPLGFMDLTGVYRSTNLGGIGTSFGSIPFNNTDPGRLSEFRMSAQNSRIGLRTHADVAGGSLTGYLEADFLGYQPANADVTSNSNSLRMRLYWVDWRRGTWEIFGGQSWSFMTPNRVGLSALPGDLFYGQEMDTNYLLGLTWARQPAFRVIAHPSDKFAIGVSVENAEQDLPSSVIEPSNLISTANSFQEFDSTSGNTSSATGVNNPNTPNMVPDVIVKAAYDDQISGHHVHFEVAGLARTFRAVNLIQTVLGTNTTPSTTVKSTVEGGGVSGGVNIELFKNFRYITNVFYGDGGGRYIANTGAPDLIIRPNGTLSPIHSGSGTGGFEWQADPKDMIYGYYGAAYFARDVFSVAGTPGGYGFAGSTNANRFEYEPTFGIIRTMWRNPAYGDIKAITQYSYVSRAPWAVGSGPATAHTNMFYIDLRYDLP